MARGISPVIATVIIVAVAIAIAIAVAFWMTGIVGLFTGFEQIQITAAYVEGTHADGYNITVIVKNTGTSPATVDYIFINGRPHAITSTGTLNTGAGSPWPSVSAITFSEGNNVLDAGEEETITIEISADSDDFAPGQSVEVKIHTTGGKEYPKLVVLP